MTRHVTVLPSFTSLLLVKSPVVALNREFHPACQHGTADETEDACLCPGMLHYGGVGAPKLCEPL